MLHHFNQLNFMRTTQIWSYFPLGVLPSSIWNKKNKCYKNCTQNDLQWFILQGMWCKRYNYFIWTGKTLFQPNKNIRQINYLLSHNCVSNNFPYLTNDNITMETCSMEVVLSPLDLIEAEMEVGFFWTTGRIYHVWN